MTTIDDVYSPSIGLGTPVEAELAELRARLEQANQARIDAENQSQRYHDDLVMVNKVMNDAANRSEWCPVYEEYIESINSQTVSGFNFLKRDAKFRVRVQITTVFEKDIEVEAQSEQDARSQVEDLDYLDYYQIYERAGLDVSATYQQSASDDYEVLGVSRIYD